jgi:hypothetical protein
VSRLLSLGEILMHSYKVILITLAFLPLSVFGRGCLMMVTVFSSYMWWLYTVRKKIISRKRKQIISGKWKKPKTTQVTISKRSLSGLWTINSEVKTGYIQVCRLPRYGGALVQLTVEMWWQVKQHYNTNPKIRLNTGLLATHDKEVYIRKGPLSKLTIILL